MERLLLFPIPTIACITGHAFAGGWLLALACDYRVMFSPPSSTKRKTWASMNEVHFGAPFPRPFAVLMRAKGSNPAFLRKLALEGHRFTAAELLAHDMVDGMADSVDGVLGKCKEIAARVEGVSKMGVWGLIKVCAGSSSG